MERQAEMADIEELVDAIGAYAEANDKRRQYVRKHGWNSMGGTLFDAEVDRERQRAETALNAIIDARVAAVLKSYTGKPE